MKRLYRDDFSKGLEPEKNYNLCVWAAVETETGRVDMECHEFEDELSDLVEGWEWKRFRLVLDE